MSNLYGRISRKFLIDFASFSTSKWILNSFSFIGDLRHSPLRHSPLLPRGNDVTFISPMINKYKIYDFLEWKWTKRKFLVQTSRWVDTFRDLMKSPIIYFFTHYTEIECVQLKRFGLILVLPSVECVFFMRLNYLQNNANLRYPHILN